MSAIKIPKGIEADALLIVGALVAGYAIIKWGIPALSKAAANSAASALNSASTVPAAAVTAAGNAVGSTLDAIGDEVLGASNYNAIPDTWSGVWSAVKGWFGGASTPASSGVDGTSAGGPSGAPSAPGSGSTTTGATADVLGGDDFGLTGVSGGW